jgi:hypothetical protein
MLRVSKDFFIMYSCEFLTLCICSAILLIKLVAIKINKLLFSKILQLKCIFFRKAIVHIFAAMQIEREIQLENNQVLAIF